MTQSEQSNLAIEQAKPRRTSWLWSVLLIIVLVVAGYLRFTGIFWGDYQYLHPDERFLVWVTADLKPVSSLGQYFNTAVSGLNPHNVGHGFYVYGTFPVIATRYLTEFVFGNGGWMESLQVGRVFSAVVDLLTVLLVYLIGRRIFNQKVGVLGAAFSAMAVMQIQQSHFYTVDSFATSFSTLALYFAVILATLPASANGMNEAGKPWRRWLKSETLAASAWFGLAVGLAMASKVNTAPVAILLPAAWLVRWFKFKHEQQASLVPLILRDLIIGGAVALLTFRILQPYAFTGPGFLDIIPNPQWVKNLKDLAAQTSGDVDFPPALQWARRPVTFSLQNMVLWGLGLPLGILSWAGFLWLGWRILKGEWQKPVLMWGWTAVYFVWQSLQGNPTMRYQLPVYPTLAVMAGWAIFALWRKGKSLRNGISSSRGSLLQVLAILLAGVTLAVSAGWAFAFTRIYTRSVTRVDASRWIFENVPGPVNLNILTPDGVYPQPLPYNPKYTLVSDHSFQFAFEARNSGVINRFYLSSVNDLTFSENPKNLSVIIKDQNNPDSAISYGVLIDQFSANGGDGLRYEIVMDPALRVEEGKTYFVDLSVSEPGINLQLSGVTAVGILTDNGQIREVLPTFRKGIQKSYYQEITFQAQRSGPLSQVYLYRLLDQSGWNGENTLHVTLFNESGGNNQIAEGTVSGEFKPQENDPRGREVKIELSPTVELQVGMIYKLRFDLVEGDGSLVIYGAAPANETGWDDGLPLRMDGYDPYGGIYEGDLNFEMYWDDNQDKLQRFEETLDRADFLFISSNRQWGTTTRVIERYPLTTAYYRNLLGCPEEKDILWCYRVAQPGMFNGKLGFELVEVFQSDPNLSNFKINDQFAEEAFTVYDHPKVLIFKKTQGYDSNAVRQILEAVDLSTVIHVIPGKAPSYPADLMLPEEALIRQREGGTWSQLFNTENLQNRYPGLGLVLWYVVILLLGWTIYPLLRIALKGLADKGYPLAKIAALLLLSWIVWIAGSTGISFTRLNITLIALILLVGNIVLAIWQRQDLHQEIKTHWRYYLLVEGIGLAFFLIFLGIRLGNPDLWHPNFGGEKPMDFAYFNAILKSTTFPPYNPWYAGSYINYYYYGFVLASVPVKWLGIVPSIAYNLILPSFFSFMALGAFSAGWNILKKINSAKENEEENHKKVIELTPLFGGIFTAIGVLIIGNLGTIRMIWHGIMRMVAPNGNIEGSNLFLRLSWTFQGLAQVFNGARLPYSTGDWYWIPSRAIPDGVITEFPLFTFLYADPHAHLFALPLTMLALGWALSVLFNKWDWRVGLRKNRWIAFLLTFFVGAVVIGSLRPTNTWDMPTYLGLAVVAVVYSAVKYATLPNDILPGLPARARRLLVGAASAVLLTVLSFVFYLPYSQWYAQGYNKFNLWEGPLSPFWSYMTHWGLFLVIIISWLYWETHEWMASTPLSSLNKLRRFRGWIYAGVVGFVLALIMLFFRKITIGWLALSVAVWAAVLLFRTRQSDGKRAVEFMIGSAAFLTLAVELVTLQGDVGRMNTVFKFYLQAWNLFAISAGICLVLLLPQVLKVWKNGWRQVWLAIVILMVAGAFLYPLSAGSAKIKDRISKEAPHTLDGMSYMLTSTYHDQGQAFDLSQDYEAIRWMQVNVTGSPVIVEGVAPEYRWGARISINTGLPTVLGWNWHQRQQRAVLPDTSIWGRLSEIEEFYNTRDKIQVEKFLERYDVSYIVVGQLEKAYYTANGLAKFADWKGDLWSEVFRDQETAVYQVIERCNCD
jgi:YYY domain-containing protein